MTGAGLMTVRGEEVDDGAGRRGCRCEDAEDVGLRQWVLSTLRLRQSRAILATERCLDVWPRSTPRWVVVESVGKASDRIVREHSRGRGYRAALTVRVIKEEEDGEEADGNVVRHPIACRPVLESHTRAHKHKHTALEHTHTHTHTQTHTHTAMR